MKRIKFLFLMTFIVIMCTGCTIEYNINITENNIQEVINVTDTVTANRTQTDILNHYNMWYPTFVNFISAGETIEIEDFNEKVDNIEYHEKSINEVSNGYKYVYKYKYHIDDYYDAYSLATAYIDTTVQKNTDSLVLRTEKENLLCNYNYFDELKVNITIDPSIYKLNYTNSSKTNNNTYTWSFDRSDCDDSEIILTLNKISKTQDNITNDNIDDDTNNKKDYTIYIFYAVIILLILAGYFIINKIKNNNNNNSI